MLSTSSLLALGIVKFEGILVAFLADYSRDESKKGEQMSSPLAYHIFILNCFPIWSRLFVLSLKNNPLNGQHLRVIWPRWEGNPKGLTGPVKSGVIIDYLKDHFNFTYEMVRVSENRLEPQGKERGLFNYLFEAKCDFLTAGVAPTFERRKLVDLTVPWMNDCYDLVYAVQGDQANVNAVIKPFQWPVWLGLLISLVVVITILNLLQDFFEFRSPADIEVTNKENRVYGQENHPRIVKKRGGRQYLYVFGNLLSQGGPCTSERLPFRLIAGVWTLAAFILVQAYTSTLFTYVVAPVNHPLINSMYDVAESTDINLFYRKGSTLNVFVSDPNATGVFLKLRKNADSFPDSRCLLVSQCLSFITPGSRNTFADARSFQLDAVKDNFEKTKKCGLKLAGDCFLSFPVTFALTKGSRYTDTINKGLLSLQQTGMIDHWDSWFRPIPLQCLANIKKAYKKTETRHQSISLKNLTGAFLILSIGFNFSFLAFLVELINSMAGRSVCNKGSSEILE